MTRPYVPPTVPGEGCERFREAALLRVDRELGPAEAAALEEHLAACPACRLRAAQAEALSTVLKDWDQHRGGQVRPPARVRISIRNAAIEQGRWRRREVSLVRRIRLATAASIVLALGAGLVLGLLAVSASAPVPYEPQPIVVADHDGPRPTYGPYPVPDFAAVDASPSRLEGVAFDDGHVGWLRPYERVLAYRALTRSESMTRRRLAFEAHYRAKAVWAPDPATGALHLMTYEDFRGLGNAASRAMSRPEPSPTAESVSVVATPISNTGRRIGHFLRLPGRRAGIERLLSRPRYVLGERVGGQTVQLATVVLLPRPKGGAAPSGQVGDLVRATREGMLVLRETSNGNLVAITKDLTWPVFVPAGELIAGGEVDRVVATGVWIPAGHEQIMTPLPCAPVGTTGASHGKEPLPTGMMAGPRLRALLASTPPPQPGAVRAWVARHLPIGDLSTHDFSLLDFYDASVVSEQVEKYVDRILREDARGIVVTDAHGNLLGVETTELPRGSAAGLLARVLSGYHREMGIDSALRRSRRQPAVPPTRTGAREASLALVDLMGAPQSFMHRSMGGTDVRVLRMTEQTTKTVVDVVERLPQGTGILTSCFAP